MNRFQAVGGGAKATLWGLTLMGTILAICCPAFICAAQQNNHVSQQAAAGLAQGDAAFAEHRMNEAAQQYAAVLKVDPGNARANLSLGNLALLQGDCIDAIHFLHDALRSKPDLFSAKGLLGICAKRNGDPSARGLLAGAFSHTQNPVLRTEIGVELANLYYAEGNLEAAVPVLQSLVAENPDNSDILFFAHQVYQDLADDTLNKLATEAPDSARMQQAMAERLVNNGNLKQAIEHYRSALKIDPYLPGAHFELGEAILDEAPSDPASEQEAQKELETALRIDGQGAPIEDELGYLAMQGNQLDAALQHYQTALRLNPKEDQAKIGIAHILMQQQKYAEAVPLLRSLVSDAPLNGEAHYRLSQALKHTGKNEESQHELEIFQQIKAAQAKLRELYQQMNQKPPASATVDPQ